MAIRKTYKEVKEIINAKGCELISEEYINSNTPLKIKCICGDTFERELKTFQRGLGRCDKCTEPLRRKRGRSFNKKDVENLMKKYNLELLTNFEDITGVKMGLDVKCKCGNHYRPTLYHLKKGKSTQCHSCANKAIIQSKKRTIEEVREIIEGYGAKLLSKEYIDNKQNLEIKCACGVYFKRRLNNVLNYDNAMCELCSNETYKNSKGELKIAEILRKHNINFKSQYGYKDLANVFNLKFDFYLIDTNTLIEYDGIQHFQPVDIFGGEEEFEKVKLRDKLKNEYCKKKNIPLLRISYKDYKNIENILIENKLIPSQAS